MTNIGIIKNIDSLGRIVIPKEYRKAFGLKINESIEILATNEGILLRIPDIEVKRLSIDTQNNSNNSQ